MCGWYVFPRRRLTVPEGAQGSKGPRPLLHIVATSSCGTLALAHGRNFGAGVDLFGVCRRRYCTSATTFRMPGLEFGVVLGTRRFARLVGRKATTSILETTRTFGAEEARTIGGACA